jgi:hypothetical protein
MVPAMAYRDNYTLSLKCAPCGTSGVARVSEDDYPGRRSPGFRVDACPPGFTVTKEARTMEDTRIACSTCGALVHGN